MHDSKTWAAIGAAEDKFLAEDFGVVVGRKEGCLNTGYYNETGALSWCGHTEKTAAMWENSRIGSK